MRVVAAELPWVHSATVVGPRRRVETTVRVREHAFFEVPVATSEEAPVSVTWAKGATPEWSWWEPPYRPLDGAVVEFRAFEGRCYVATGASLDGLVASMSPARCGKRFAEAWSDALPEMEGIGPVPLACHGTEGDAFAAAGFRAGRVRRVSDDAERRFAGAMAYWRETLLCVDGMAWVAAPRCEPHYRIGSAHANGRDVCVEVSSGLDTVGATMRFRPDRREDAVLYGRMRAEALGGILFVTDDLLDVGDPALVVRSQGLSVAEALHGSHLDTWSFDWRAGNLDDDLAYAAAAMLRRPVDAASAARTISAYSTLTRAYPPREDVPFSVLHAPIALRYWELRGRAVDPEVSATIDSETEADCLVGMTP